MKNEAMQHHSHRHRKWRRFIRNNQKVFFAGWLLVLIMAVVVLIFWLLTSPRFAKFG